MPQLDSLRAFAVLAVLIHHFYPEIEPLNGGNYGVKLFFVLSGFLITGILLDSRTILELTGQRKIFVFRQFYLRRTLRIFPLYYFTLLTTLLLGNMDVISGFWWYTTYTSNFFFTTLGYFPWTTAHLWSLAVEEQFYLIWPFVIFLVPKRLILCAIILMILVGPGYRLYALVAPHSGIAFYVWTLSSVDSLGWGALLAWLHRNGFQASSLKRTGLGLFLLYPILTTGLLEGTYFYVLDYTLLSVGFVWLIAGAAKGFSGPAGVIMNWKPLIYIGKISYGVYLYHLFTPWGLYEVLGLTQPENLTVNAIILITTTILVASLSWHFFEKPINGLKKHFPYPELIPNAQGSPDPGPKVGGWGFQRN
jgi:peptidoglycan/LPS O-acetylase OafA/YrhL